MRSRLLQFAGILLVTAAAGLAPRAQAPALVAHDAWVRQPLAGRNITAAFVVLENHGSTPLAIVGASSPDAETLELHEMKMDNGMMRMSPVERIEVPAGGQTELKPGGLHIMLFGVKKTLEPGTRMPITLTLDDGTTIVLSAEVRKVGDK